MHMVGIEILQSMRNIGESLSTSVFTFCVSTIQFCVKKASG